MARHGLIQALAVSPFIAIWQFDLLLVPHGGFMPRQVDDGYEVPSLQPATAAQAHAWLCQRVGEPWQMLEEWLVFGKESGNRFDFILNEDGSAEVSARIDARSDPAEFIHGVCELSCLADACFIQQN